MPKPPIIPLALDVTGWFGPGGLVRGDVAALFPHLEEARRQLVVGSSMVDWPERLLGEYRERRGASDLGRILTSARALADRADRVVILGTGSLRLAAEAIFAACCHPYHNELNRAERACKPRLYFVSDTLDNDHVQGLLDVLGQASPIGSAESSWGLIAIDSPGGAPPLATLNPLLTALTESCGANRQQVAQRLVAVTNTDGQLAKLAAEMELPNRFELPSDAGQGGGALSAATLLSAVLLGLDVVALLDGAAAMSQHFAEAPSGRNIVLDYAAGQFLLSRRNPAARLFSLQDRALVATARWYQCLLDECLGSAAHVALSNTKSDVKEQQYVTSQILLKIDKPRRDRLPGHQKDESPLSMQPDESAVPALFEAPRAELRMRQLNEAALGQFLQWLQLATAIETQLTRQPVLGEARQNEYNQRAAQSADDDKETSMATTLTWLGHASWLIETSTHTLLVDPFLDESPTAPIKASALKPDFILISHGHFDHVGDSATIAVKHESTVIANYEICEWLGKQGVENTQPMNIGGGIDLPFGRVKMTIAHHSSTLPDGASGGSAGGYLLSIDGKHIYLACDTGLFYDMKLIGSVGLDLAVLPIGDRFTMGPDDALEAVKLLQPKRAVPSHFNTWPPIAQDGAAWAARVCQETGVEAVALNPGEKIKV